MLLARESMAAKRLTLKVKPDRGHNGRSGYTGD
jgi:hypothetical protein